MTHKTFLMMNENFLKNVSLKEKLANLKILCFFTGIFFKPQISW